jgi:hypothetical protein
VPIPRRDFSQIPIFPPDRTTRGTPTIQPKLIVGQANDPLEYEADSVAAQVMQMSAPAPAPSTAAALPGLRRKCSACEEEEKKQRLQAKPIGAAETAAPARRKRINSSASASADICLVAEARCTTRKSGR